MVNEQKMIQSALSSAWGDEPTAPIPEYVRLMLVRLVRQDFCRG